MLDIRLPIVLLAKAMKSRDGETKPRGHDE
jgi:hypothetical protein